MPQEFNAEVFKQNKQYEMERRPIVKKLLNKISKKWMFNDDPEWQISNKLDGYLYIKDKKYWFDVKNVRKNYPRIMIEDRQNFDLGWLWSNAGRKNVLIIYCLDQPGGGIKVVIFLLHKLKKYVLDNKDRFYYSKDCPYGYGWLVPIIELQESIGAVTTNIKV